MVLSIMSDNKAFIVYMTIMLMFLLIMAAFSVFRDREDLRLKLEAGLIQKIEGGTVIWTKP